MVLILVKIRSFLQKPKVWRFVCLFSAAVGLVCYALSSSFNHLFGKWTWWKILFYSIFSLIICLAVLFAKAWERSSSPRLKARMAFFILMITSVYSFFFDKQVKGKPDASSLVSSAAFAVMSLGLARQSHLGFEIDLLYFFCGVLTVQLMKINLWLVSFGGGFSYSLIILRSTLDAPPRNDEYFGFQDQDHVVIEFGSRSQSLGTANRVNPSEGLVDSPQAITLTAQEPNSPSENEDLGFLVAQSQEGNGDSDGDSIVAQFMDCIEVLKKENGNIINTILKNVDDYLKANLDDDQIPNRDDNLVVDSLPSEIINNLRDSVRLMVTAGLEEECLHVYSTCRREFLSEILSTFVSAELNMVVTHYSIKALCVADRILLPNERRLCERVFEGSIHLEDKYPALPGIGGFEFQKSLEDIYPALPGIHTSRIWGELSIDNVLPGRETFRFKKSMSILGYLLNLTYGFRIQAALPDGRIHWITSNVLDYARMIYEDWQGSLSPFTDKERNFSLNGIEMITDLLDNILEANFKNYNDPALSYLFIINNRHFIDVTAKRRGLKHILGADWLQNNITKFQQNRELYQRNSWNKILDILRLDINESEPIVAVEILKNKLRSFNDHFEDICNVQPTWFVSDDWLRKQIVKSIENILLPAYGSFIGRLQDFLGNHAYEHIKYGMFDVRERLNNLFLVRV